MLCMKGLLFLLLLLLLLLCNVTLCLNNFTLHNDICKGNASLGIILRCFIHFCDDMPDDCRTVETCSMILRRRVFEIHSCV